MQKTLCLKAISGHSATKPKLKEGKVREINLEWGAVFYDFRDFGGVFDELGNFLTFIG